jgi:hypothetical protein
MAGVLNVLINERIDNEKSMIGVLQIAACIWLALKNSRSLGA